MEDASLPVVVDWRELTACLEQMFASRGLVMPDPQDAASFLVSEAVEVLDIFLRRKNYVRNHPDAHPQDSLEKEIAQCLMMLGITCMVCDIDLDNCFTNLYVDYLSAPVGGKRD